MINKMWLVLLVVLFTSCDQTSKLTNSDICGLWKIELAISEHDKRIPFFLEIIEVDQNLKAAIWNGEEQIVHDSVLIANDTVIIESPYFNSKLYLDFSDNKVSGFYQDYSRGAYKIPLTGKYNLSQRFKYKGPLETTMDGTWEVVFSPNTDKSYKAIGLFNSDANSMKGTFITETGDYRFLEGGFAVNELQLSTFDGAHAFLFEAKLNADTLRGMFYSGQHFSEPFVAWKNDNPDLMSPYEMSELTDPNAPISFSFKDLKGEVISITDSQFIDKPMLVQIMGSWCPNCMDEAKFLVQNKNVINDLGVEVVALSFEKLSFEEAKMPLHKLKDNLNLFYPVLYAGKSNKQEATKSVPWLKEIKSYPTLIFVLPNKKVFKIHTGFYGPSSKSYYEVQSKEMLDDLKQLAKLSTTTQ